MIPGIDVSLWDAGPKPFTNIMNWAEYPYHFAFIKVGEGTFLDPAFLKQWNAARGHVYRGAYHFFRPNADPHSSVVKTLEYLDGDLGELPLALDLEVTDNRPDTLDRAKSWLSWYEALTGIRPIVYSSPGFLGTVKSHLYPYLSGYKLWLAQYYYDDMTDKILKESKIAALLDGKLLVTTPKPPVPFKKVSFWQWTARLKPIQIGGYYMGSDGKKEIDGDFYLGSLSEMMKEFDLKELPVPNPPAPADISIRVRRT